MIDPKSVETVLLEMIQTAMRNERPDPEQLGAWIQALSETALSIQPRDPTEDGLPTYIEFAFSVNRARIETSCCVPHAVGPLFRNAWDSLDEALAKALWRVPAAMPGRHRPRHKH